MTIQYHSVNVTPFRQRCNIVWCDETMKGVITDPGGDVDLILEGIKKIGVTIEAILLTHGHLDHISGTCELNKQLGVPVIGPHKDDEYLFEDLPNQCQHFGFPIPETFLPTQWLNDGDSYSFGNQTFDVIHTPGHTPGHVVLFNQASKLAIVGDVIFKDSVGRTDLPRGDTQTLLDSITQKLWPLGNDVLFVPGHGRESTFGQERQTNPFVADRITGLS